MKKTYLVPVLESSRLRLRPLSLEDAPAVFEIHSDPETLKYWGHGRMATEAEAANLIRGNLEWVESGMSIYWAMEFLSRPGLIGTCTLFKMDEQNRRAEVGYILNRTFWGQGLMSEALSTMIDYAFQTLELHRLEADTDPKNSVSLALLKKFGFKHEGYFRERWWVHGQWLDSDMLGLLRSEYPPNPESPQG
ncbi:MAG TPA: GNAT family N-acetyltransferase [Xanthomonadales bacterium]|nr:GNAT family N-acetyltransferase [Xanthomonadales bacterium]